MANYSLTSRSFLRLSGPDAERYLNGQITQDVSITKQGKTLWTAVTNAKGQLEGVGCVCSLSEEEYLLDFPAELGDIMEARLEKYLIADDCEWRREDDQWSILIGEDLAGETRESNRFRNMQKEQLVNGSVEADPLPAELEKEWRVRGGVPAWGTELKEGMLPAEGGLHELALSFYKGCYIGQEIISRMENAGKTRTQLYQVLGEETSENSSHFTTYSHASDLIGGLVVSRDSPADLFPQAKVKAY